MSWQKRLRIMWAVWRQRQQWHVKTCAECAATWLSGGPLHEELIHVCDACEAERINRMLEFSEREYERITRGAA